GDEGEGGPSLLDHRLAGVLGEDQHGHAERRVVSPPAVRVRIVLPGPFAAAEHPPAHDDRSGCAERFLHDLGVGVLLAALEAVALAKAGEAERPLVQLLASLAERLLERL